MVSAEFRSCRELLAEDLERGQIEVATQEKFANLGETTLEKLEHYIKGCEAMIHVVGDGLGHVPPKAAVEQLLIRNADFLQYFGAHTTLTRETLLLCSYTQWEAYLAIFFGKRLHIYRPGGETPREDSFASSDEERSLQASHFDRIRELGRDRDVFLSQERLSSFVLADLSDILPSREETPRRIFMPPLRDSPRSLIGREPWMARLDEAWNNSHQHVLVIRAWGGAGKTSIVNAWMTELALKDWRDVQDVFYWSFYSQGAQQANNRAASADLFIAKALDFFGDADPTAGSPSDRGERLARLVGEKKTLLVLDGLEPLQHPPGPLSGILTDPAMSVLLSGLAAQNAGLCVVTTRESMPELDGSRTVVMGDLDPLTEEAGAAVLHYCGAKKSGEVEIASDDKELQRASAEVAGHALTLTLMGKFLNLACTGDIRRRDTFRLAEADAVWGATKGDPKSPYGHAFSVIAAYERWFLDDGASRTLNEREESRLQISILRLMGLFNCPASPDSIDAIRSEPLIPGLTEGLRNIRERTWGIALSRLEEQALLQLYPAAGGRHTLDAHPLVREYFSQQLRAEKLEAFRHAHSRLFDHFCESSEHRPATLEGLQPLYQAVGHGCLAGRHQEALDEVLVDRIFRGSDFYSTYFLGAMGADLGAIASFFDEPWSELSSKVVESNRFSLFSYAAFRLRAMGRLREALQALSLAMGIVEPEKAATCACNRSELNLILGKLQDAESDARKALDIADQGDPAFQKMLARATAANALHEAGKVAESHRLFLEAEAIQVEEQPEFGLLYSLRGYQFCDLILAPVEVLAWRAFDLAVQTRDCRPGVTPREGPLDPITPLKVDPSYADNDCVEAIDEAHGRAEQTLEWMIRGRGPDLDVALSHLTLARTVLYRFLVASDQPLTFSNPHLEQALSGLRKAGTVHHVPKALLLAAFQHRLFGDLQATNRFLDEAQRIAERGPMPLYAADVHLYRARLFQEKAELAKARSLIDSHGYVRRQKELAEAEAIAALW